MPEVFDTELVGIQYLYVQTNYMLAEALGAQGDRAGATGATGRAGRRSGRADRRSARDGRSCAPAGASGRRSSRACTRAMHGSARWDAGVAIVAAGAILRSSSADRWNVVEDTILATPVIGLLYTKFVKPVTYYSEDTRLMFEDTAHRVVLDVVGGILTLNKPPEIPAEKLKPQSKKALV